METIIKKYQSVLETEVTHWFKAAPIEAFPPNGGACIKYQDLQIAVFRFSRKNAWYATQNLCPHKLEMVLSRGLLGDEEGVPKVACPLHKKTFSLETGENFQASCEAIAVYPVRTEGGYVYIGFKE
ncbi:MAG: nitrite reductase small subunit NirD [Bacteroidota bacterium]